jgi:hypothetical protein
MKIQRYEKSAWLGIALGLILNGIETLVVLNDSRISDKDFLALILWITRSAYAGGVGVLLIAGLVPVPIKRRLYITVLLTLALWNLLVLLYPISGYQIPAMLVLFYGFYSALRHGGAHQN